MCMYFEMGIGRNIKKTTNSVKYWCDDKNVAISKCVAQKLKCQTICYFAVQNDVNFW